MTYLLHTAWNYWSCVFFPIVYKLIIDCSYTQSQTHTNPPTHTHTTHTQWWKQSFQAGTVCREGWNLKRTNLDSLFQESIINVLFQGKWLPLRKPYKRYMCSFLLYFKSVFINQYMSRRTPWPEKLY